MSIYVRDALGSPPYDILAQRTNRGALASTFLAVDIDGKFRVTCDVVLHKHVGWHHEFKFAIVIHANNHDPMWIYSSQEARDYVPEARRADISDIVCQSVRILIGMVRPDTIFRQLAEPNKPSLRLHDRITHTISEYGYELAQHDLSSGKLLHRRSA